MHPIIEELKKLLEEHNCSIYFDCDDCSDWYGITGDRMVIANENSEIISVSGTGICPSDL